MKARKTFVKGVILELCCLVNQNQLAYLKLEATHTHICGHRILYAALCLYFCLY